MDGWNPGKAMTDEAMAHIDYASTEPLHYAFSLHDPLLSHGLKKAATTRRRPLPSTPLPGSAAADARPRGVGRVDDRVLLDGHVRQLLGRAGEGGGGGARRFRRGAAVRHQRRAQRGLHSGAADTHTHATRRIRSRRSVARLRHRGRVGLGLGKVGLGRVAGRVACRGTESAADR